MPWISMAMNGWHITYKPSGPREYMQYTLCIIHLSFIHPSIYSSIHPSIYLSIYSSIHLFTYPCHHIVSLMRAARLTVMNKRIDNVRYCTVLYRSIGAVCVEDECVLRRNNIYVFVYIIIIIIITSIILTINIIILSSSSYYHHTIITQCREGVTVHAYIQGMLQ